MNDTIKRKIKRILPVINYLPLNNKLRLHGTKMKTNGAVLINNKIICKGTNNLIIIHRGAILRNCVISIKGDNNTIEIGENSSIRNADFCMEDSNNKIKIGEKTYVYGKSHFACIEGTSITIGSECLFSSEVVLRTGDSHSIVNLSGERINQSADITIDNHVWICHRVMVNKGVYIAADNVIANGAIVTRSIEQSNVVVGGIPAKVIQSDINWCPERIQI